MLKIFGTNISLLCFALFKFWQNFPEFSAIDIHFSIYYLRAYFTSFPLLAFSYNEVIYSPSLELVQSIRTPYKTKPLLSLYTGGCLGVSPLIFHLIYPYGILQ